MISMNQANSKQEAAIIVEFILGNRIRYGSAIPMEIRLQPVHLVAKRKMINFYPVTYPFLTSHSRAALSLSAGSP